MAPQEFLVGVSPKDPTEDAERDIDIVFIHGLNPWGNAQHARQTWTHMNGTFWPEDLLPLDVPTARILLFGYNSNVTFDIASGSLRDNATSLLESLRNVRTRSDQATRPIIFICHSLGGILIKQALVTSMTRPDRYESIRKSTAGLVFFGTPHNGADKAATLKSVANIFSALSGQPRNALLETLKKGSFINEMINEDFNPQSANYKANTYWEKSKTDLKIRTYRVLPQITSQFVVLRSSAKSGIPNEVFVGLDASHSDMCKFSGIQLEDSYHNIVGPNIREMANDARRKHEHAPLQEAEPRLAFVPFDPNPHFVSRSLEIEKLKRHFSTIPHQRTAALYGLGGVGKSQIASEYCHLQRDAYPEGILWFNAESQESLLASWRGIANDMHLPKDSYGISSMKSWLRKRQKWLAVLDGLRDLTILQSFTTQISGGNILVTTQDSAIVGCPQLPFGIDIKPFERDDTIRLFVLSLQSWDTEEAGWIREELPPLLLRDHVDFPNYEVGRILSEKYAISSLSDLNPVASVTGSLPIAIVQCASYLRTCTMPFSNYVDRFNHVTLPDKRRTLHKHKMSSTDYNQNVMTVWEVSFQGLRSEAANMLVYFGFMDRSLIRESLLQRATSDVSFWDGLARFRATQQTQNAFSFLTSPEYDCDEALGRLVSLAFVQRTYARRLLSVQPMVHEWCHLRLSNKEAAMRLANMICLLHGQLPPLLYSPDDTSAPTQADEVFCHLERVSELTRLYMCHLKEIEPACAVFYVEAYLWYKGDLYMDLAEELLPYLKRDGKSLVERMVCGARLHQVILAFQASRPVSLDRARYNHYMERLARIPFQDISALEDRFLVTQTMTSFRLMQVLDVKMDLEPSEVEAIKSEGRLAQSPNTEEPRSLEPPSLTPTGMPMLDDLRNRSPSLLTEHHVLARSVDVMPKYDYMSSKYEVAQRSPVLATTVMVSEGTKALIGSFPQTDHGLSASGELSPIRSVCAAIIAQCQAQDAVFDNNNSRAIELLHSAQRGAALGVKLKLAELQPYFGTLLRLCSDLEMESRSPFSAFIENLNLVVSAGDWSALMQCRGLLEGILCKHYRDPATSALIKRFAEEEALFEWIPQEVCFENTPMYVAWLQRRLSHIRAWDRPSKEVECVHRLGPLMTQVPSLGRSAQKKLYVDTITRLLDHPGTSRWEMCALAEQFHHQLMETQDMTSVQWLSEVMFAYIEESLREVQPKDNDSLTRQHLLLWAQRLVETFRTTDPKATLDLGKRVLECCIAAESNAECNTWALITKEALDKVEMPENATKRSKSELCEKMVCYFEVHNKTHEDRQLLIDWTEKLIYEKGITEIAQLEELYMRILISMEESDRASKILKTPWSIKTITFWHQRLISLRDSEHSPRAIYMSVSNTKLSIEMKVALSPPTHPIGAWTAQHRKTLEHAESILPALDQFMALGYEKDLLIQDNYELKVSDVVEFIPLPLGRALRQDAEVILALQHGPCGGLWVVRQYNTKIADSTPRWLLLWTRGFPMGIHYIDVNENCCLTSIVRTYLRVLDWGTGYTHFRLLEARGADLLTTQFAAAGGTIKVKNFDYNWGGARS